MKIGFGFGVKFLLGFGRYRQNWATGENWSRLNLYFLPQTSVATKFRRDGIYWTLATSRFYLFYLRSYAASVIGARQPGIIWDLSKRYFLIFRDILHGINQFLDPLKGIIQLFYFYFLATIWVAKSRDICRGLILLLGIGAWVMEQYLPAELCSLVSLGGIH